MDDHELNEKMARLCRMGVSTRPYDFRIARPPFPYISETLDGWELVTEGALQVAWNPANDWQLVHDDVIPAANSHGLDVKMSMLSHWTNMTSVWKEDTILRSVSEGNDQSHCMLTCLAILEAWEKTEADDD